MENTTTIELRTAYEKMAEARNKAYVFGYRRERSDVDAYDAALREYLDAVKRLAPTNHPGLHTGLVTLNGAEQA